VSGSLRFPGRTERAGDVSSVGPSRFPSRLVAIVVACLICGGVSPNERLGFSEEELRVISALAGTRELRRDPTNAVVDDPAAVLIGRDLFFDPRLSGTNAWSCATCHQPARGWSDGEAVPSRFPAVTKNTQSLWDIGFDYRFFWDGRIATLWQQAVAVIESPDEMEGHRLKIALLVYQDIQLRHGYENLFGHLGPALTAWLGAKFGQNMTLKDQRDWRGVYALMPTDIKHEVETVFDNIARCLAAFERRLVAGESRFDRFAHELAQTGMSNSLSDSEQRGLALFVGKANCVQCHSGPAFSDGALHEVSVMNRSSIAGAAQNPADRAERDVTWVKTARLRNIALSAPYMHDGRYSSLREVVDYFADEANSSSEITRGLVSSERDQLVGFLGTLTDSALNPRDPGGLYAVERYLRSTP
jgi:cytochrome c peroxidase